MILFAKFDELIHFDDFRSTKIFWGYFSKFFVLNSVLIITKNYLKTFFFKFRGDMESCIKHQHTKAVWALRLGVVGKVLFKGVHLSENIDFFLWIGKYGGKNKEIEYEEK